MNTCKKCNNNQGTVLLRKKDLYCEQCFISNINHKFRACIGKNKILTANENVLICVSGGPGSTALLDFIHSGVSLNNHKRLWITPCILHIVGKDKAFDDSLIIEAITEKCKHYKFNVYIAHVSEYILINDKNTENRSSELITEAQNQFKELIESLPLSSRNDFLVKVTRDLFKHYAKTLQCKFIFTAETSGTLAINLLSNLSNGRGSQVQYDIGFCDNRDEVIILRPMKDISQEELRYYIKIKKLLPLNNDHSKANENSLQAVIEKFVTDLQENFQSTISTVCKTADKIGIQDGAKKNTKCTICQSSIGEQDNNLTALEATDYSRTVSTAQPTSNKGDSSNRSGSMFPLVNKSLCYTCSRHFSEMEQCKLPVHIREILK